MVTGIEMEGGDFPRKPPAVRVKQVTSTNGGGCSSRHSNILSRIVSSSGGGGGGGSSSSASRTGTSSDAHNGAAGNGKSRMEAAAGFVHAVLGGGMLSKGEYRVVTQ